MIALDFGTKLSPRKLEEQLKKKHPYEESGWSSEASKGLLLDLSRVEWVEPVALVRLVLLVQGCVECGVDVDLRLPRTKPATSELRILNSSETTSDQPRITEFVANGIRRRRESYRALIMWDLEGALRANHMTNQPGKVRIVRDFDWSREHSGSAAGSVLTAKGSGQCDPEDDGYPRYHTIMPLTWVGNPRLGSEKTILKNISMVDVLSSVAGHQERGVRFADARTLAYVFVKELAENVYDHAGEEYGLLAAWARPASVRFRTDECLDADKAFLKTLDQCPVIEIVLGDAGKGIPKVLSGDYDARGWNPIENEPKLSKCKRILFWALDRWSTTSSSSEKRGTRGLYRVDRVTRKYKGCLTLRSENEYIGTCYDRDLGTRSFWEKSKLAHVPGTVIHARLPMTPANPTALSVSSKPLNLVKFDRVDCTDVAETGAEVIVGRVESLASHGTLVDRPRCIVADVGMAEMDRSTLEALLRELLRVAHPCAVIVAPIGAPYWDSCLEAIRSVTEEREKYQEDGSIDELADSEEVRGAVLAVSGRGECAWLGLPDEIAMLMAALVESRGECTGMVDRLSPKTRETALDALAGQYHIAQISNEGVISPLFNIGDVIKCLKNYLTKDLLQLIKNSSPPQVYRNGPYRTPSQENVTAYVRTESLLCGQLRDRAVALLSMTIRRILQTGPNRTASFTIVTGSKQEAELGSDLQLHLADIITDHVQLDLTSRISENLAALKPNQRVLLFTDLILTGNHLGQLLGQVRRRSADVQAIACIFDARPGTAKLEAVEGLGLKTSLVSLAHLDLVATKIKEWVHPILIDPLTRSPESDRQSFDYLVSQDEFDGLVSASGAMYFDHIARPPTRHFTFYLDGLQLLGYHSGQVKGVSTFGKPILNAYQKAIDNWMEEKSHNWTPELFYVSTGFHGPNPETSTLSPGPAEVIARSLAPIYEVPIESVHRIDRKATDDRWGFGPALDSATNIGDTDDSYAPLKGRDVIVIEWGSMTGESIRNIIRLAAASRVRRALVVVFLSQLATDEEIFLRTIRRVERPNEGADASSPVYTDIRVEFLHSFRFRAYRPSECPCCRTLQRLDIEETQCPQELIETVVDRLRQELQPKNLEVAREQSLRQPTPSSDLLLPLIGEDSGTGSLVRMARFREKMENALRWNWAREEVIKEIEIYAGRAQAGDRDARSHWMEVLRLLEKEPIWFDCEPLRQRHLKMVVAKGAAAMAACNDLSVADRRNAMVVLRAASKEHFCKELPAVLSAVLDLQELVAQALYLAFAYLCRPYLTREEELRPIVDALESCLTSLRASATASGTSPGILWAMRLARTLHAWGVYLIHKTSRPSSTAQEAWNELKDIFGVDYHSHHQAVEALRDLFLGPLEKRITDQSQQVPQIRWDTLYENYVNHCEPFLVRVLDLLRPVQQIVGSVCSSGLFLAQPTYRDLAALVREEDVLVPLELGSLLETFSQQPEAVRNPQLWGRFIQSRSIQWNLLMDPGRRGADDKRTDASALITILQDCPCDARDIVGRIAAKSHDLHPERHLDVTRRSLGTDFMVFCHSSLLERCLRELLRNVAVHALDDPKQQVDSLPVSILTKSDDNIVSISVLNKGSAASSKGERIGIATYKEELSIYGGNLTPMEKTPKGWDYGITITLPKG